MLERLLEWDRSVFIFLNNLGIKQFYEFWSVVTEITTWIPLFIAFFLLILLKYKKREGYYRALVLLGLIAFTLIATHLTKVAFERIRPNNDTEINTLIRILKSPEGFSFFSGHAATSFAITTLVVLFLRGKIKGVYLLYIWPLLFSLSRIYVGVHYPGDIIIGALVGTLTAYFFYYFFNRFIVPYSGLSHP